MASRSRRSIFRRTPTWNSSGEVVCSVEGSIVLVTGANSAGSRLQEPRSANVAPSRRPDGWPQNGVVWSLKRKRWNCCGRSPVQENEFRRASMNICRSARSPDGRQTARRWRGCCIPDPMRRMGENPHNSENSRCDARLESGSWSEKIRRSIGAWQQKSERKRDRCRSINRRSARSVKGSMMPSWDGSAR